MRSKSGIRWLHDGIRPMELPNGRRLELASREGANDFVDSIGTDFMSTNLTAVDDQELEFTYMLMITVADTASTEKTESGIPESELRTFIEHMRDTLDTLSTDRNWLPSGTVSMRHGLLLPAIVSFSMHPSFLEIFLSNEGLEAVAKFYASRKKNDKPNTRVAQSIRLLVSYTSNVLMKQGLSSEKAFGTIEKTGRLGQFIRCVPADPECSADIVKCLQTCLQLVKKKLKSGTPTGDIFDAVIAGKDGSINEKAKSGLVRLQRLALLSNTSKDNYENMRTDIKMCSHCEKTETQMNGVLLMKCQG
jgi:hypothetical protein